GAASIQATRPARLDVGRLIVRRGSTGMRWSRGSGTPTVPVASWTPVLCSGARHQRGGRAMAVILGTGEFRYEVVEGWAKLPPGREFNADVAAGGGDAEGRGGAFNRRAHPIRGVGRAREFLRH